MCSVNLANSALVSATPLVARTRHPHRTAGWVPRLAPWLGLALGLLICSEPLVASALGFKPPRRGIPGRREGGGTRNDVLSADPCSKPATGPQFAALMPDSNFALTTTEFPRFFWSAPRTKARFAEFTLHESAEGPNKRMVDRALVYRTTFRINGNAGVTAMALPANAGIPGLAVGQDYHWTISLVCNPQDRKQDARVEGWVQRIAPDAAVSSQLFKAAAGERPRIYAANGLWIDALSSLADLRYANPTNAQLTKDWDALLDEVKLPNSKSLPLIQPATR
jgi:hypothetical protein